MFSLSCLPKGHGATPVSKHEISVRDTPRPPHWLVWKSHGMCESLSGVCTLKRYCKYITNPTSWSSHGSARHGTYHQNSEPSPSAAQPIHPCLPYPQLPPRYHALLCGHAISLRPDGTWQRHTRCCTEGPLWRRKSRGMRCGCSRSSQRRA